MLKYLRIFLKESSVYKIWKRFLTWFGDQYFATEPPRVKAKHIREVLPLIKKGDILLRKYNYYLDSYFIKGKYSHSGICLDDQNMIHSIAEGVGYVDVIDFIKDADGFILIRPPYQNETQADKAIAFATAQIGKPYDFLFEQNNKKDAFYCHELTFYSIKDSGLLIKAKTDIIYGEDLIDFCGRIYEL